MTAAPPLQPSRLRLRDAVAVAVTSVLTRRLRATLTAGGVAIGIAAMVAVLGVSSSGRADLLATLDALGTNLLTVRSGQSLLGEATALPDSAPAAIRGIGAVETAGGIAVLEATVRRTDRVPEAQTSGLRVAAAEPSLLEALQIGLVAGRYLDTASRQHPTVVLGATAARRLGVGDLVDRPLVWIGRDWFAVVGLLEPAPLAPEVDSMALIGWPAAETVLRVEPGAISPTTVYVRSSVVAVDEVRALLPRTANPATPDAVRVSRPSDALAARDAADTAFTTVLLGLGGVALLVGGIGIANVMVIAVLERREEIGLRRALGATRGHIRTHVLVEAVSLSAAGGVAGVALGAGISAVYAAEQGWPYVLPPEGLAAGVLLAALVGALAGVLPAARAARLQPAEAIRPR